jgi:hypothetical protein
VINSHQGDTNRPPAPTVLAVAWHSLAGILASSRQLEKPSSPAIPPLLSSPKTPVFPSQHESSLGSASEIVSAGIGTDPSPMRTPLTIFTPPLITRSPWVAEIRVRVPRVVNQQEFTTQLADLDWAINLQDLELGDIRDCGSNEATSQEVVDAHPVYSSECLYVAAGEESGEKDVSVEAYAPPLTTGTISSATLGIQDRPKGDNYDRRQVIISASRQLEERIAAAGWRVVTEAPASYDLVIHHRDGSTSRQSITITVPKLKGN